MKLFFTYYGGKYRIAKYYPPPNHDRIIEPFAGSAGFSTRFPEKEIILCDLNPKVCGVWQYLIKVKASEILKLPEAIEDVRNLKIPQEAKWLIGFWLNKGTTHPCCTPSKRMREGLRPNSYWGSVIKQRIANQVQYIRHWKIFNKSYTELDNLGGYWFVDAPYNSIPGQKYVYNKVDYAHLSEWAKTRNGQAVVCEMEGANWMNFEPLVKAKSSKGYNLEVVWIKEKEK
jgi:hypothetical protein